MLKCGHEKTTTIRWYFSMKGLLCSRITQTAQSWPSEYPGHELIV